MNIVPSVFPGVPIEVLQKKNTKISNLKKLVELALHFDQSFFSHVDVANFNEILSRKMT